MPTRNVNLTDHHDEFVEASVASGRYEDASEVIRAGLRLLERQEQEDMLKLERLREAARIGFESADRGEFRIIDDRELDAYVSSLGERAAARLSRDDR